MVQPRTGQMKAGDFARAERFEQTVAEWLPAHHIDKTKSTEDLDFWVPGWYLDVKERHQKISAGWPRIPGVKDDDLFIIDELSVRKALKHYPHAYFLLHDVPGKRVFLARVDEIVAAPHIQVDRVSASGHAKGKWVVGLLNFRLLKDPKNELTPTIFADQLALPWKRSECLSQLAVPRV